MDENKTPAQQAPDTAAPETTNIEQTTQPETTPAPEVTAAPEAPAQKAGHGARWHHALWRGIAGVLAAVVLLSAGVLVWRKLNPQEARIAKITQKGQVLREIDLTQVKEPYSFVIEGENGALNTVQVEPGRICISEASCPDQICVHQGWIGDGSEPIVCLPNQVIIQITGGGSQVDAAAG